MTGHKFENFNDIKNFMFAGNATVTVVSKKTGDRVTFRVRKPKDNTPFFVSVLSGNDNENNYSYLGTVFDNNGRKRYVHGKKSKIGKDSKSNKVFNWVMRSFETGNEKFINQAEIYHERKCGRCGRKLTVPESIIDGLGPFCKEKMGL